MNHTYQIRRYAALTAAVILSACMLAGCAKSDSSARDNAAGSGNGTNASGNVVAGAGGTSNNAGSIQEATSFLPDYAFADNDTPVGTTVSGVVGSAMVAGVAVVICLAGGFFRKKKNT